MTFVQIIHVRTSSIEEVRRLGEEYGQATEGRRTVQRHLLCQDRDRPGTYLNLVFFDSYEAAMENSDLPETREFAARLASLLETEPEFINLDVIEER